MEHIMGKLGDFRKSIDDQMKESPTVWKLAVVLRTIVFFVAIRCAWAGRWEQFALCLVVLFLFIVPACLSANSRWRSPRRSR